MNNYLDTAVIALFSLFVLGVGLLFSRRGNDVKTFFAGGESVPWFIGGLSLFMSFFSAGTFVAWGSIAYKYGWVAITIQWTMCIGALVTGFWIAPKWKKTGALTAAEFIRQRLGLKVQKVYIFIFTVVNLFIKGSVLYPVSKLVSTSLDLPLMQTTIGLGFLMISYTAAGGLWAVMVTDILQFVVLTASVFILLPISFDRIGGIENFNHVLPPDFFDLLNGEYTIGFIVAFTLYHISYIAGNWTFVQRYTSVDSPQSARKVGFLFAALYLVSPIVWMLPPMIYKAINPSLQGLDVENAYLYMCQLVLPAGLLGLMLTGMYFSTSASANTALNVVSAVFTNDVYKGIINPDASENQLMRVARLSSWFFGIIMIVIALLIPYAGGIVEVILSIGAVTGGPLLVPSLWALFSKKLSGKTTLNITLFTLFINLIFKIVLPIAIGFKLTRAEEMMLGMGLPILLIALNEWFLQKGNSESNDYTIYIANRRDAIAEQKPLSALEKAAIRVQNQFGLRVIGGSLIFTALFIFGLGYITDEAKSLTMTISGIILLLAMIPLYVQHKRKAEI
ncbi:MAG: sodium:solute symporter family protein [Chitinophagia bacterium]|jgi:SSS family solute:Na+ symporter